MKTRLLAMGSVVFCAAALVACGGGGGGGTPPPTITPTQTPTITPTVTPTPTINPYGCVGSRPYAVARGRSLVTHPIAAGDYFTYTGSLTNTFSESAPCVQPTSATSASASSTVTAVATTLPNGAGSGSDLKSVETDIYPTLTQTTTTDQSVNNSASAYLLYALKVSDSNGNNINTIYTNPQQLDQLPEQAGQSWGNGPAGTLTETLADGTAVSRTIASDGSYIDNETFPGGNGTVTITVNGLVNSKTKDGSGVYSLAGTTFTYAPPTGPGGTITLTIAGTPPKTRTFPAWFTVPSSYITDSFVDNGSQALDPSCGVSSSLATSGTQVVETHSVLDPVLGYQETRTTTSYNVTGYGAVCVKIDDTLNSFYDYQNDTTRIDYQSQNGQPNSVDHFVEYLGMSASGGPYSAIRTASSQRQGVSPLVVAQHVSALELRREVERAQKVRAMHDVFVTQLKGAAK